MKNIILAFLCIMVFATAGCAPRVGGSNYSISGVGEIGNSEKGTITAARKVTISASRTEQDNKPGAGAAIGGVTGAVVGSQIGKGATPYLAGAAGAIAGGFAGHFLEQKLTDQEGMEYHIKLDSGRTVVITQGLDPMMGVGQRVTVIESLRDRSRVVPVS